MTVIVWVVASQEGDPGGDSEGQSGDSPEVGAGVVLVELGLVLELLDDGLLGGGDGDAFEFVGAELGGAYSLMVFSR